MELPTEIIISITQDIVNEYNEYYFAIHPRAKKKPIAKPYFTTLNEMLLLNNKAIKNAKKQEQQEFVKFILEKYELWDLKIKSCCLHVKFCYSNRIRHDLDNSICILKPFLDQCVLSGMLIDDDYKVVRYISTTAVVEKENSPRVDITFYNIVYQEES